MACVLHTNHTQEFPLLDWLWLPGGTWGSAARGGLQPHSAHCREDCPASFWAFPTAWERNSYLNAPALLQRHFQQNLPGTGRDLFVPSLLQEQAAGAVPQNKLDILVKNQLTLTEDNLDKQEKKK